MSAPEDTKVLVLGAGIGGLTAAVALRRAGFEVEVHERASELRPAGSGIAMLWNSLRALGSLGLGLEDRLAELGGVPTGFRFAKPNGRTIRALPPEAIVAPDGLRSLTVHRGDVQRVLLEALDRPVELGRMATGFSHDAHGVRVQFSDGTEAAGDLLIGADGIHSVVRARLHGAEAPRPGGFVCWLATIPFEHPLVDAGYSTHYWGRGKRFGLHDIGGGRVYWWGTKTMNGPWSGTIADVRAEFADWAPECVAAIDATTDAQLIAVPAQDRAPLVGPWGEGRVTLLGDAAHPMLPSLGQGANQAIEDAVVLARELASATGGAAADQVDALRRYEAKRAPRVKEIVDVSRKLGGIEQTTNPLAVAVRDRYFQHVPKRVLIDAMVKPAVLPPLASSTSLPRPLSPLERWHWILGTQSPLLSIARVQLQGAVDEAALRGALDALQQRHPLLRSAVETDDRGRKARFVEQPPREIPLRVVVGADDDLDAAWDAELQRTLLATAFDFAAGALLTAVVVSTAGSERHDLVLVAPCLVADADAVLGLARECLALLDERDAGAALGDAPARAGAAADAAWAPAGGVVVPGLEELFPPVAKGLRGLSRAARGALAEQAAVRRERPLRVVAEREIRGAERRSGVVRAALGGAELAALREAAEERRLHPRSVVAAALAAAVSVTAPAGDAAASTGSLAGAVASGSGPADGSAAPKVSIGVMTPVRGRVALDAAVAPGALGSYQSLVAWIAQPHAGRALWELAADAEARCAAARAAGSDLTGLALLRAICPSSPSAAGKLASTLDRQGPGNVCLSYAESPLPQSGVGGCEVVGVEAILTTSIASMLTVSATASPAGLALNVAYVEGAVPRERAQRIVDLVADALRGAAAVAPRELLQVVATR